MALYAHAIPVTITGGGSGGSSDSDGVIVEADGTDVVAGNEADTDDPGKTIFAPSGSGVTVIPTQKDPTVVAPGGIPAEISGGSDGVVVVPGPNSGVGGTN